MGPCVVASEETELRVVAAALEPTSVNGKFHWHLDLLLWEAA